MQASALAVSPPECRSVTTGLAPVRTTQPADGTAAASRGLTPYVVSPIPPSPTAALGAYATLPATRGNELLDEQRDRRRPCIERVLSHPMRHDIRIRAHSETRTVVRHSAECVRCVVGYRATGHSTLRAHVRVREPREGERAYRRDHTQDTPDARSALVLATQTAGAVTHSAFV